MKKIWNLGNLPFVINANPQPTNHPLPDFLPFSVTYDKGTNLLMQVKDSSVSKILEKAYQNGSMLTGFMTESGLGRKYADDFLSFITNSVGMQKIKSSKILEIGCGTGYLLARLRELGAEVVGIEPGVQRNEGEKNYGLLILNDFFPTNKIYDFAPFDLVIEFCVLEHSEDINLFLEEQHKILSPKGLVVLAVPDCKPYIDSGDISMFTHEHYSYFTEKTLTTSLLSNGFKPFVLKKASFGGSLYCIAEQLIYHKNPLAEKFSSKFQTQFSDFVDHAESNIRRFKNVLSGWQEKDGVMGIYCPARALNILFKSKITDKIRFFDDNALLHGRYYPCFSVPIESYENFKEKPVKHVLIMSHTFFSEIAEKLSILEEAEIHSLKEFFGISVQ